MRRVTGNCYPYSHRCGLGLDADLKSHQKGFVQQGPAHVGTERDMGYAKPLLEDILKQLAPDDEVLSEARDRRDLVIRHAKKFPGVRDEAFNSGSVAHGSVTGEVSDADCGVVLNRSIYPWLGPDGDDDGPKAVAEDMREHLRESAIIEDYEDARFYVDNRAVRVEFNDPFDDDQDPSVDLILGLERKDAPGLWIPKGMRGSAPSWDASDPEAHTRLFLPDEKALRRTRVRVTRLGKAWNNRFTNWRFSSFNLASLAYWGIEVTMPVDEALAQFFAFSASDLAHRTFDPAEVSGPIKLPVLKEQAIKRIEKTARLAQEAYEADSEDAARDALAKLFPSFVQPASAGARSHAIAKALRSGITVGSTHGRLATGAGVSVANKRTRSHGGRDAA